MSDIYVRGLPVDKKERLKKLAIQNGYKNLSPYLVTVLGRLAESNEVVDLDRRYQKNIELMIEALDANTKALKSFVEIYGGEG